jgi:2-polyprenyl-3-methyl-5-hydroxy-6-metoxy-1,4-benzoquinol methylase
VLQQEELSRQQEQAVLQQEELSRQQEQAVLQQGSLNQHQEALNGHRDELDQHLGDIKHSQDQTLGLQNQFQAQHEFTQELEVRFSALARNLGFEHAQNPEFDRWYQNLQDLHRGSGEALAKTQSSYLPYFESLSPLLQPAGPILDLGCGRGEWLSLLARQGWQVRGVDSSELVVEVARENGLDVQLGDLLTLLEAQPANSLAAVTAFQVIEHLPFECIVALVHAAFRALLPGGILLLETPNPENIQVAAYSFWMDPTHKKPIPPPLIMDLSYHAGFRDGLVLRQNPWPNWDQTPAEPSFEGQMNQRLFGPQDYAVLAYKPVTPS